MADKNMNIRKPAVAGLFYPGNSVELSKTIAGFYAEVEKTPLGGPPMGLIVPHAGYPYSGRTAAKAYKVLVGEQFDTVVVVSPSHTVFFKGSSVYDGDGYQTPLGVVEIDKALSKKIATTNPSVYLSKMGHASGGTRGEHALEVQLPFLQIVLGKFKLVAIVMGDQEEDSINTLGESLAAGLEGTNTLLVASSDLSHFHSEKEARKLDYAVQEAVEKYDPSLLVETLESHRGEACGGGPMAAIMMATQRLGGREVKFIDYSTSGETTGDFDEVVGYLAAAVVGGEKVKKQRSDRTVLGAMPPKEKKVVDLSADDKKLLHQIVRDAIKARFEGKEYEPPEREALDIVRGAFVTLKIAGELQGCIGQIKGRLPLNETVADMAVSAAFEDPRFMPLREEQFESIEVEISVLSPLERAHDFSRIETGRDGLMIKMDMHSGLLLPQVATEYGWNTTQFLEQTCLKAGLPKNAYKDRHAEIYKFTAEVF
jgi:AmmeMemoRadiSam system protein B/AmmeMemoRadiSam system protein A